jgi:hypothetical protein
MAMDRRDIDAELERVTADFHRLLDSATGAELGMPTNGTKWTNKQLLFHMLFGFILVRALLPLVKGFGCLPPAASRTFAAILNAGTRPFHVVNYLSALPGGTVLGSRAMGRLMDSTIERLRHRVARESEHTLGLAMHFPVGWDPYFKDVMTVADHCRVALPALLSVGEVHRHPVGSDARSFGPPPDDAVRIDLVRE